MPSSDDPPTKEIQLNEPLSPVLMRQLQSFSDRDRIFIVDEGPDLTILWQQLTDILHQLSEVVNRLDGDGLDLRFVSSDGMEISRRRFLEHMRDFSAGSSDRGMEASCKWRERLRGIYTFC